MKLLLCTFICGLLACGFNELDQSKLISAKIDRVEKARLGKGYYKATYYYSFKFLDKSYNDSTEFYLGDSKMRRVNIGDDVQIEVHNNKEELNSEFLESNFELNNKEDQCFIVGQYSTQTFERLEIFHFDNSQYKLINHLNEKGPLMYGWNKVFIKRANSKGGKYFALEDCEIVNGEYHIKSNEDNIGHTFIINKEYLIHMFNDTKEIYYFMK